MLPPSSVEESRVHRLETCNSRHLPLKLPPSTCSPAMPPASLTKETLKRKRTAEEVDAVDGAGPSSSALATKGKPYKQRVLVTCSRGISQRQRHLMQDLLNLLPHAKKGESLASSVSLLCTRSPCLDEPLETKLEDKHNLPSINELCYLSSCNNALFFEARRQHNDLYLWAAKTPNGPSVRFHVLNSHTMDEMKMTGNCLKGSRPIVVFDQQFEEQPHLRLIKEVLSHVRGTDLACSSGARSALMHTAYQIFAVPKTARRAKPFVDHVVNFSIADGKIWFRNYQVRLPFLRWL